MNEPKQQNSRRDTMLKNIREAAAIQRNANTRENYFQSCEAHGGEMMEVVAEVRKEHNSPRVPNKEGIWEWFKEDGTKRLMNVYDTNRPFADTPPAFRVYWWGGYYDVSGPTDEQLTDLDKAEWPKRWGNYVGPNGSVQEDQLYLKPTPVEREKYSKIADEILGDINTIDDLKNLKTK